MFNTNIFGTEPKKENIKDRILKSDIIFISDMFAEDYIGGAELTTEAFYEDSDSLKVCKIKANQINPEIIQHGIMKHWVFFNYASLDMNLIPVIIANLNYSIVEYIINFASTGLLKSIKRQKALIVIVTINKMEN